MAKGRERRRHERRHSNLFVLIENPALKETIGRGVVTDVSISGMAVEAGVELDVGQEFDCYIEFPVRMRAKVVRRLTKGQSRSYGFELKKPGFFDRIFLKRLFKGKLKTTKV